MPKLHLLVLSALSAALVLVTYLPSNDAAALRYTTSIEIPKAEELALPEDDSTNLLSLLDNEQSKQLVEEQVQNGDSLSRIFGRAGLDDRTMFKLVNSCPQGKKLADLFPGQKFVFELNPAGELEKLIHKINRFKTETYTKTTEGFSYSENLKKADIHLAMRASEVETSLYNAGVDAGLKDQLIMELAGIFGWDIDFALDIRKGDSFKILFEEKFLEGEKIGVGKILAAEFVNQNTSFKAVLYKDKTGKAQYYSPDGRAMRKAFLRAPLDFRRISSNFNPRRLHPITKTVRPHRGTDYAANRGTPVWAAGAGKVIASGYTKSNGNYIVIQHGGEIRTKYLHLHKRKVKKGARVKQKQIIGTVGSTGMSTAPHLHYEFLLNGVHRNPRTIVSKLPKAKSIPKEDLQVFFAQTHQLVSTLENTTQIAGNTSSTTSL